MIEHVEENYSQFVRKIRKVSDARPQKFIAVSMKSEGGNTASMSRMK